jgi:hypothetical protein
MGLKEILMLTLEQGAKYFIVGWIKDWSMRTLIDAMDEKHGEVTEERIKILTEQFPFLPSGINWYISKKGRGQQIKVAMPDISKKLNDALWEAKDNQERLSFYTYVMKLKTNKAVHTRKYSSSDQKQHNKELRENNATFESYKLSREYFKKSQGRDWFTVK